MFSSCTILKAALLTAVLSLAGCSGSSDDQSGRGTIRLLNASIDYDSLDLYVETDDDDASLEIGAVASGDVSPYVELKSDTYTIRIKRAGGTSTVQTLTGVNITDGSHIAFVAYGRSGELLLQTIDEDTGDPDPDSAVISHANAAGTGEVDVYLTDENDSLDDASPLVATETIDSGTYRLRITGDGDKDDLRLDVSDIEIASEQVATFVLTATPGGALVNAYLLEQQGELTKYQNGKARVRGAVGLASGSSTTLRVGGATLLSNAAVGVIGNVYAQVDAGSATVNLTVGGNTISTGNLELEAGADYTVLVWSNQGVTEARLISDDNYLPDGSATAKVRLLNGLFGLTAPITLTIDFFPVIEGISRGDASGYVEVDSGLAYQYDVSDSTTTTNIWTRDSIELQNDGVYTLFMSGGDSVVNGSLRRDR